MITAIANASTTKSPICSGSADFIWESMELANVDAANAALANLEGALVCGSSA